MSDNEREYRVPTTREIYPEFQEYLDTVVATVPKLNLLLYNRISESLDEFIYDLYYREVSVEEATRIVTSLITHFTPFLESK